MNRRGVIAGSSAVLVTALTQPVFAQAGSLAALVSAAKAEGGVVVDGPPIDASRDAIVNGFQKAYGIPVSYISSGTSASGARVRAERAAGKYLLDVFISGSDTPSLTFLPGGWLDKVEPILVAPDVIDKHKWKDGHIWFADPGKYDTARAAKRRPGNLAINTKLVKRGELTQWKQLLEPKWQGKFVAKDPASSGAGQSLTSYFYIQFGPDFVKKLYQDQKPILSRDARQAATWLAQGNYPVVVGPDTSEMVKFQYARVYPDRARVPNRRAEASLTGSWGTRLPHEQSAAFKRREAYSSTGLPDLPRKKRLRSQRHRSACAPT